jgi:hypothetical protein
MSERLVAAFTEELDMIVNEPICNFTSSVLESIDDYIVDLPCGRGHNLIDKTKEVVSLVNILLDLFDTTERGKAVFISAAILHDVFMYCQNSEGQWVVNDLHPLLVRDKCKQFKEMIDEEEYNGIMDLVECHPGMHGISPKFIPRHDLENGMIGVEWILTMADAVIYKDN